MAAYVQRIHIIHYKHFKLLLDTRLLRFIVCVPYMDILVRPLPSDRSSYKLRYYAAN